MARLMFQGTVLPRSLRWYLLGWLGAEVVAFLVLVKLLGFGGTVLLGLATSVLGIVLLRRLGSGALARLAAAANGRPAAEGTLTDGLLAGLGAVLLVLPGFVANFVGLALSAPSIRHRAALRLGGVTAGHGSRPPRDRPDVIDLEPTDWRPVERS